METDNIIDKSFLDIPGRISSFEEFLNYKDKTVWTVTVPKIKSSEKNIIYGNSFLNPWIVDECYNEFGNKIPLEDINNRQYLILTDILSPHATKIKNKNNKIYRYLISLVNYNVIDSENTDSYHAIFYCKNAAELYRTWLAVNFGTNNLLHCIDDRVINCKLIDWEKFLVNGLEIEI